MSEQIRSERLYSEVELKAMRRLGRLQTLNIAPPAPGRGIPYFGTGDYYPKFLDQLAKDYVRAAEDAQLVAAALRREHERWPEK